MITKCKNKKTHRFSEMAESIELKFGYVLRVECNLYSKEINLNFNDTHF